MASKVSEALAKIQPRFYLFHDVTRLGTRVSGKDRSLPGKARIRARRAKRKLGGW